jgi:RNA polymerase sigma factor (sigma-70 family)
MTADLWGPLRRLGRHGPAAGSEESDEALLERFAGRRDEAAFAELLRRHGPRVWGVCRRGLPSAADAEDAFQATFLVLARKANAVRRRASVASWLHGVALRVVACARRRSGRPPPDQRDLPARSVEAPEDEAARQEFRRVLDEEVGRLPEKYRMPVVLCYFDGESNESAARRLGWPAGTVCGRLARARDLLRKRLTRRGVALTAGGLGAGLANPSEAVPAALAALTPQTVLRVLAVPPAAGAAVAPTVVALAQGVIRSMTMTKLKLASLTVLSGFVILALGVGAANRSWRVVGGHAEAAQVPGNLPPPAHPDPPPAELPERPAGPPELADLLDPNRKATPEPLTAGKDAATLLKDLLTARRDAARQEAEARYQEFMVGRRTPAVLLESVRRLEKAELQLTDDPGQQFAVYDRSYQLLRMVEQTNLAQFEAGWTPIQDYMQTRYACLDAEIDRLKARMRMDRAPPGR